MGNKDVRKNKRNEKRRGMDTAQIEEGIRSLNLEKPGEDDEDGKSKDQVDFVQVLPMEVIEEIFLYLSPKDLAACTAVSMHWREAVNSNKVWGHQCEKRGWTADFDPNFSHFAKAHRQFRRQTHSYTDMFNPMCQKRFLYNQHCSLQANWRRGTFVTHKINATYGVINLIEPVSCGGNYLVTQERYAKNAQIPHQLDVWSLYGVPSKLCNLRLPFDMSPVDAIAFDHATIVIAQSWKIVVYMMKRMQFELTHTIDDLSNLQPHSVLPKDMRRLTPHLKVTEESIVCVPSHSHSTVDFIPVFFWDRLTGQLKAKLNFDSMYYTIPHAVWFKDSCYLSLVNKKIKSYQIVELGVRSETWGTFSQSVGVDVEKILVSNQYVLAVVKTSNQSLENYFSPRNDRKEVYLWDRVTGAELIIFDAVGKCFQFVNNYLMFFEGEKVTVMHPRTPSLCSEFEVQGTISSIRASSHPSIMLVMKNGPYIEVWDWGRGTRIYTITTETGYGSQLWCDEKRIITYHPDNGGTGILLLGYC